MSDLEAFSSSGSRTPLTILETKLLVRIYGVIKQGNLQVFRSAPMMKIQNKLNDSPLRPDSVTEIFKDFMLLFFCRKSNKVHEYISGENE